LYRIETIQNKKGELSFQNDINRQCEISFKINPYSIILFLVWPFIAFIMAIRRFELPQNKAIVYLFMALFGFTFILGNEAMDSFRYAERLQDTALLPFNQFYNIVIGLYSTETSLDIMMPLVNFIVSRFTTDHRILLGVWALIFGYFYVKSIGNLHDIYSTNQNINALFFIILFIVMNPISNINGYRMWTAAWVFFYGTYQVVVNENKRFLFLSLTSVLFHFSFISASLVLLIYVFIGNRNILYYILVIASFIIPVITLTYLEPISNFLGEGIADKIASYASSSTIEAVARGRASAVARGAWYLYLPGLVLYYYMIFTFFYVKFKYFQFIRSKAMQNLFSFSLLFLAFSNFVAPIPSMGRFFTLFYLFALSFILMFFANRGSHKLHPLVILGIIPLSLKLIIELRMLFDVLNPWLFGLLPIPFILNDASVYELLFK